MDNINVEEVTEVVELLEMVETGVFQQIAGYGMATPNILLPTWTLTVNGWSPPFSGLLHIPSPDRVLSLDALAVDG